jgi:hypothetical protein
MIDTSKGHTDGLHQLHLYDLSPGSPEGRLGSLSSTSMHEKAVARRLLREQKTKLQGVKLYSKPTHGMISSFDYVRQSVCTFRPCKFWQPARLMPYEILLRHSQSTWCSPVDTFCDLLPSLDPYNVSGRRTSCHCHVLRRTVPHVLRTSSCDSILFSRNSRRKDRRGCVPPPCTSRYLRTD